MAARLLPEMPSRREHALRAGEFASILFNVFLHDQIVHVGFSLRDFQVGDGFTDHAQWTRPEDLNIFRPFFAIYDNPSQGGADLAGQVAGALAAGYLVFKDHGKCRTTCPSMTHNPSFVNVHVHVCVQYILQI